MMYTYQHKTWTYDNRIQYATSSYEVELQIKKLSPGPNPFIGDPVINDTTGANGIVSDLYFVGPNIYIKISEIYSDPNQWGLSNLLTINSVDYEIAGVVSFTSNDNFDILPETEIIYCNTKLGPLSLNLLPLSKYWNIEYRLFIHDFGTDGTDGVSGSNPITILPNDPINEKINVRDSVELSLDGGSVLVRPIDNKNWAMERMEEKYVNIEYSKLYDLVVEGKLSPGTKYRLTDYRSVNFLNGWQIANNNPTPIDPSFIPREIYKGDEEVLILEAISENEIAKICYSEKYPGDIIEYEPYVNKIGVGFDVSNGSPLPDSSIVSGFDLKWDGNNVYFEMPAGYPILFGHYLYLYCSFDSSSYSQEGTFDPIVPGITSCQYPISNDDPDYGYLKSVSRIKIENNGYKVLLLDLDFTDFGNYDTGSLYIETVYEIGDSYGWITRREDTHRNINVPFDFRGRKYRRYEIDLTPVNNFLGVGYYGIGDNPYIGGGFRPSTGNYKDFVPVTTEGYDVFDVKFEGPGGPDMYYRGSSDNNIFNGNFFRTIIQGGNFYNNTISDSRETIISGNCYSNIVDSIFNTEIFGFFADNLIKNMSANFINGQFTSNIAKVNFSLNNINGGFIGNTIGSNFLSNNISPGIFGFNSNIIGDSFRFNNILVDLFSTNFTTGPSTHVYGNYNCRILRASDGSLYLEYFDGTNVQYVSPTA